MNISAGIGWLQSCYPPLQLAIHQLITHLPAARRVCEISIEQFTFLQNVFVTMCGVKELTFDRVYYQRAEELLDTYQHKRYSLLTYQYILTSHRTDKEFYEVHGVVFTCSGLVGMFSILYKLTILKAVSNGFFIFSNFVALKYHATLLKNSKSETIRASAAIGIVSNLGYIVSFAIAAIGYSAAMALFFGILAVCVGGIKIIYDLLVLPRREKLTS